MDLDVAARIGALCDAAVDDDQGGPLAQYRRLDELQRWLTELMRPRISQLRLARGAALEQMKLESGASYERIGRAVGIWHKQQVHQLIDDARRQRRKRTPT